MASKDSGGGQQRATRSSAKTEQEEDTTSPSPEIAERQEKLTDDVDAMLDEIDDVLEENAEDFVRSYVQKGGQ